MQDDCALPYRIGADAGAEFASSEFALNRPGLGNGTFAGWMG